MTKYQKGDWLIQKVGRPYQYAFKLTEETSLWYSGHTYASAQEVEKVVSSEVYWEMRQIHLSMVNQVFSTQKTFEQAITWVDECHIRIQNELPTNDKDFTELVHL